MMPDGLFEVHYFPSKVKFFGIFLVACKFAVAMLVGWGGVVFLRYTNTMVNLILNCLSLVFILELDAVLFQVMLPTAQQMFLLDLKPVRYKSMLPNAALKSMRMLVPLCTFTFVTGATFGCRWYQMEMYKGYFDNAAALCLFSGPSPHKNYIAPVPGFCESVMKLSCDERIGNHKLESPCVIQDYDVPWPNNVRVSSGDTTWADRAFSVPEDGNMWNSLPNTNPRVAKKFNLVDAPGGTFQDYGQTPPWHRLTLALQRACNAMYHSHQPMRTEKFGHWNSTMAPFYCHKDSGILKYFSEFDYSYTTSWMTGQTLDVTSSIMDITDEDPKIGRQLFDCVSRGPRHDTADFEMERSLKDTERDKAGRSDSEEYEEV
eukprot:gnl/TRDRNA2_/TRDRNA2_163204_c0_seq1.p1 gnl/TRDRNA2_/TRDRNA2_163204_c0~~gnl/TRDRNA2_/TRDRNA2_163204_c0_seq1.p1  ORF type:complete len:402 (-),score=47.56 gnl/TRDRNA2_/TRDRNA2_163204_c0_seq1:142-1263(-)